MAVSSNIGTPTGPERSPRMWCALGLMSGTSLDGIDVAMVETDGYHRVIAGPALTPSYPREFRERLRSVLGGVGPIAPVEDELTRRHAAAVREFLQRYPATTVDIVRFHGPTILYPPAGARARR